MTRMRQAPKLVPGFESSDVERIIRNTWAEMAGSQLGDIAVPIARAVSDAVSDRYGAYIDELRSTIAFNREQAETERKRTAAAYTDELLAATSRSRQLVAAFDAAYEDASPTERAALTRVWNRINALGGEQ